MITSQVGHQAIRLHAHCREAAIGLALGTSVLFFGCAPVASLPPPIPLPADRLNEAGLAASGGVLLETNDLIDSDLGLVNGQLWYNRRLNERMELGGTVFGGIMSYVGGGLTFRDWLMRNDVGAAGIQISAGYAYLELGGLFSRHLRPAWSFISAPALSFGLFPTIRLPLGLAYSRPEMVVCGQVSMSVSTNLGDWDEINLTPQAHLSFSYRF